MRNCRRLLAAAVGCLGCCALPIGCAPAEPKAIKTASTQPAAAPADVAGKPQPLPAKALLELDRLEPAIAKPTNPEGYDKLPARAEALVAEAEKHLAKRDHAAAVRVLERAIGFDPANARMRGLLGRAYLALRDRGKAIANLRAAVNAAPDDLTAQLLLGQLAAAQKQNARAIVRLRTALRCSDAKADNALAGEAMLTLSLLLEREGYWTAALECYGTLSDWIDAHGRDYAARPALREWALRPERLLARRGALLLLLRRHREAAAQLRRAHRRDRTNRQTARLLIDALLETDQFAEAEKLLLEMARQPAQRGAVPTLVARLCRRSRDKALPERFWKAFREKNQADAALGVALAAAAQRLGWDQQARSILHAVLAIKPADADLWATLCRAYAQPKQYPELVEMIDQTVAADANTAPAVAKAMSDLAAATTDTDAARHFADLVRKRRSPVQYAMYYLAGKLAAAKGKHLLAADLYERATEAKRSFYPAYEALLETYIAQKRADRVDGLVERVAKLAGDTHLPAYFRGKVAASRGQTPAAIDAFQQALRQKPDDLRSMLLLARVYVTAGRIKDAVQMLLKALKAHRDETDVYRLLFEVYIVARRPLDAGKIATALLRRRPDSIAGRLMLAELAVVTGRRDEAIRRLARLEEDAPGNTNVQLLTVQALLGTTPGLVSRKDFEAASAKLRQIIRAQPGNRDARGRLAELLAGVDKTAEAAGLWAVLFDEVPTDGNVARRYVAALVETKRHDAALRAVQRHRKANPDDFWFRLRQIELLGELKRFDELQPAAAKWISDARNQTVKILYRQELVRVLRAGKQYETALRAVADWLADSPNEIRARALRYLRIQLLTLGGKVKEAAKAADELMAADPNDPGPRQAIVLAAIESKQHDRALELVDRWVADGDKPRAAYRALKIILLGDAKRRAKARRAAEQWLKEDPKALQPHSLLVGLLAEEDKYAEADRLATKWLKRLSPTTSPTQPARLSELDRWLLATSVRLKLSMRQHAEALKLAERHLKLDPKDTELLQLKSACLSELGRDDEALAELEAAWKLKPDDASLNNNLGYLYAERGIHLDKAQSMIQKALAKRRGEVAFTDSLAWVFYKRGRIRDAGRVLQQLFHVQGDEKIEHGVIYDHAGDVYYRLGWKEQAEEFWKLAIDLARKDKHPGREVRRLLAATPAKIEALRKGREPAVAPLGQPPKKEPSKK